jgi:hypothetical protein
MPKKVAIGLVHGSHQCKQISFASSGGIGKSGQGEGRSTEEEEEQDDIDTDDEEQQEEADISMMTTSSLASNSYPRHGTNETIGELRNHPACALHLRQSFLKSRPSYLRYFWEVADSHQLLQSSLQCLTEGTGAADASDAPTTVSTPGFVVNRMLLIDR